MSTSVVFTGTTFRDFATFVVAALPLTLGIFGNMCTRDDVMVEVSLKTTTGDAAYHLLA